MTYYMKHPSPLGTLTLFATEGGLCGLYFEDQLHPRDTAGSAHQPTQPHLLQAVRELGQYFASQRTRFEVALDLAGTTFQREAWQALCAIPFGQTASYGAQAQRIGRPKAARAIGGANARNPVAIIVPCHRVIGASGAATGYDGGIDRKRFLLAHEGVALHR